MFRGILPKEFAFFDFFDQHIALSINACQELYALNLDGSNLADQAKKIKELENQMDKVTLQCVEALHKTFITPFERTDILQLVKRMDDIPDCVNKAVSRIKIYDIDIVRPEVKEIAEVLVAATKELQIALAEMRHMKNIDLIREKCQAVRELESKGDAIFRKAISQLFKENNAMDVIKWKEILARFEKAVNRTQDVANIIEEILIESA